MAITYSISGGADATKFNINSTTGAVTFKTPPDFEVKADANQDNVYEFQGKAVDSGGASAVKDIKIMVADVNENLPPQITSAGAVTVSENTTTVAYTIVATDADLPIVYSISGVDAVKFDVNSATGAVTFKSPPDFEAKADANQDNVYELLVKATDSVGTSSTKSVLITVSDVAENLPPQITSAGSVTVSENITTVVYTMTAIDPDDVQQPPTDGTLPALTPSGSITVSANNQIIENKLITGTITANGKSGVTIRNCWINHPSGEAIAATNCTNLTIQDVKIVNTSATSGLKPNNDDESKSICLVSGGPFTIQRVTVEGSGQGIYAYETSGKINISFLEGHKARGGQGNRGCLVQFNKCSGGAQMEDFSSENPSQDSWTGDNVNTFTCSGSFVFRRGLIDGNNHPAGCGFMFESTSGALVEDCDLLHMGNGGPGVYSGEAQANVPGTSSNMIYRRIRIKDTLQYDQGRGPALSGYTTYTSSPGCINTKFEQCKHFNVNLGSLAWDTSTMTTKDWVNADFTPRAPIRNRKPGT